MGEIDKIQKALYDVMSVFVGLYIFNDKGRQIEDLSLLTMHVNYTGAAFTKEGMQMLSTIGKCAIGNKEIEKQLANKNEMLKSLIRYMNGCGRATEHIVNWERGSDLLAYINYR